MSETFEMVDRLLSASIENIIMSIFDSFQRENAETRAKAGLTVKIIRRQLVHCCDWCAGLEGTYEYGQEPDAVYKRHRGCRCTVITDYGTGKGYQDVWSKRTHEDMKTTIVEQQGYLEKRDKMQKQEIWEAVRKYDRQRYYEKRGKKRKIKDMISYDNAMKNVKAGGKASMYDVIMNG